MAKLKLSREQNLLIVFSSLRNITDWFLGTFLVSFIMHLSINEITSVSVYKMFEYVATCAGFFVFARWCKRYNKVTVFTLNLIPKILLLGAIIILQDRVADYLIPLGLLCGIGAAMYHLPMNSMVGEKVPTKLMGQYIGRKNAVIYATKVIAPVVLGFFIDTGSYTEMAYALLALTLIELGLTFGLTPSRHRNTQPVDFAGFARCMMRFPIIRKLFLMEILRGFGIGLLGTVITMYTVYMFQTDFKLGIFTTIFSGFSIVTSWVFGRYGRRKYYPYILGFGAVMVLTIMAAFVTHTTPITFLLYNMTYATAIVVMDQIATVNTFNLSRSKCVTKNHKIEYFVLRDFALFIGRWIGFTGLMYIGVFGGYAWLRWYLIAITGAILLSAQVSSYLSKNIHSR